MLSGTRLFIVAAGLAFALFLTCLGLHQYLYTFDPYGWAVPGQESVVSRNLFLERAHLYRVFGVVAFGTSVVCLAAAVLTKRHARHSSKNARNEVSE